MFAVTPENAPRLAIGSLGLMVAVLIITLLLGYGFSVAVMMLIATAGFLTILFVMAIGATHGESPVAASDSEAVTRWNERVASRSKAVPAVHEAPVDVDEVATEADSDTE